LFYQAELSGCAPPDIVPHPDHVDVVDDRVIITGPIDRNGRRLWEERKAVIAIAAHFHQKARERLRREPSQANAAHLKAMQVHRRRFMRGVPKGWKLGGRDLLPGQPSRFVTETLKDLRSLPDV
jgi:hypothetical protein